MYILYVSLYDLGFEFSHYLFLLTFLVLIPYQASINNLEWTASRISAYIRAFYEDEKSTQRWETMNTVYEPYRKYFEKKATGISFFVRSSGSVHLAFLSTISFIVSVLADAFSIEKCTFELSALELTLVMVSLLLLLIVETKTDPASRSANQNC